MKLLFIKIFFKLLSVLMIISIASLAFIYYLLSSERGANFVFAYTDDYLLENFSLSIDFQSVTGTFVKGLSFDQLNLQHPQFSLQAQSLESSWSLWSLFNKKLNIETLEISGLSVSLLDESSDGIENDEQNPESNIAASIEQIFNLPLSISINTLDLSNPQLFLAQQNFSLGNFSASLTLDQQAFQIDNLIVRDNTYTLAGSAAFQATDFLLDGNLDWTYQSAAGQNPASEPFNGSLLISGDISNLDINHNLIQPLQVVSNGSLSTGLIDGNGLNFSLEHSVEDVIDFLPLPEMLTSIEGNLLTHGSPELIFIDADLELQTLEFLPINLLVSGEYQDQSLSFETVSVISPEIDLQLVADFDLQNLSLEADWRLNNLVLDSYLDSLELQDVNGGGSISANANGNAELNLSFLTARLNDYQLEASGQLGLVENSLSTINLELNTGSNRIALDGLIEDQFDINWLINAPDLSIWLPALSGQVVGNGLINGDFNDPVVSGSLQVSTLEYLTEGILVQLENLQASILTQQDNYQFNISLLGLSANIADTDIQVSESQINLNGSLSEHLGDLSLSNDNLELGFNFSGAYANENWQGRVLNAQVDSNYGVWQLQNSMGLSLSRNAANIASHCWAYLQTGLCLDADISEEEILFNTDITDFPLVYLNTDTIITQINSTELNRIFANKPLALAELQDSLSLYLPSNSYMQGLLNGQLELRADPDSIQAADFILSLQPENFDLNLFLPQESDTQTVQPEIRTFSFGSEALMLSRTNGSLSTNADINIYHQESSGLDVQGDLSFQLNMDGDKNLQGVMALDLPNIDWLETLLPEIRNTRGELLGQLELLGSLDQPRFISDITLRNGSFELPEYGIKPEQIFIDFISDDQQNLQIVASADSGAGNIGLTGQAASLYNSNRTFQLTLTGENFDLINNEGTRITVSPDVAVNFTMDVLDIQGKVNIPELNIDIRENGTVLINNGTDVSRDILIVNAPPEQAELLSSNRSNNLQEIPITANLELELGDNAHFQGLGLDLMLNGNLQAQQDLNRPLLVYGDISIVDGFYEIYGQRLEVANGKLIFFGNPLNPALDIRANRQGSNVQAGVQINGTLRNMQSQLFSTPTLPDSEILSILITGKSFADTNNQEQGNLLGAVASLGINRGQGLTNTIRSELGLDTLALNSSSNIDQSSIGLGKYLTPDIFMHYEIGLFESESTLSLEYILTQRLRLEVESGISQSIDMTYTVEK